MCLMHLNIFALVTQDVQFVQINTPRGISTSVQSVNDTQEIWKIHNIYCSISSCVQGITVACTGFVGNCLKFCVLSARSCSRVVDISIFRSYYNSKRFGAKSSQPRSLNLHSVNYNVSFKLNCKLMLPGNSSIFNSTHIYKENTDHEIMPHCQQ